MYSTVDDGIYLPKGSMHLLIIFRGCQWRPRVGGLLGAAWISSLSLFLSLSSQLFLVSTLCLHQLFQHGLHFVLIFRNAVDNALYKFIVYRGYWHFVHRRTAPEMVLLRCNPSRGSSCPTLGEERGMVPDGECCGCLQLPVEPIVLVVPMAVQSR
jgi:hypothetical protein